MALALLCSVGYPSESTAQPASSPTESQVKAVYLYNFGRFVRWQPNVPTGGNSFDICILGKNPFGGALEATVSGESIDGKTISAQTIVSMQDAGHCRILFISASEEGRLKVNLAAARRMNALTVSDIPGFVEHGGMIGLVRQGGRIRFEVNVAPMGDAGLTVSSELLKVATRVIGVDPTGGAGK
jgi:hypothetical protein